MRSKVRVECDADVVAVDNLLSMYKLLDTEKENKENGILNKIIYYTFRFYINSIFSSHTSYPLNYHILSLVLPLSTYLFTLNNIFYIIRV